MYIVFNDDYLGAPFRLCERKYWHNYLHDLKTDIAPIVLMLLFIALGYSMKSKTTKFPAS